MANHSKVAASCPHVCSHRLSLMLDNPLRRLVHRPEKILDGLLHPGDQVVDMGCGPGFFTLPMARMVGPRGGVTAIDLQPQMLGRVRRKAEREGIQDRLRFHQCRKDAIGLRLAADFILVYYMIHETPDPVAFLRESAALLIPGGLLLAVEPRFHVSRRTFESIVSMGREAGMETVDRPSGKGGRAVLFARPEHR